MARPACLAVAGLFLLAPATSACSPSSGGGDGGPSCPPYQVPSSFDPTTPVVSFQNDIVTPVFRPQCGLSAACHQRTSGSVSGLYLGSNQVSGSTDIAQIYGNLVGKPSVDLPTMDLVTAGDAANSFIMHKLDGDQCVYDSQCTGGFCLTSMPQNSGLIEVAKRDTIRRWIDQGAKNN